MACCLSCSELLGAARIRSVGVSWHADTRPHTAATSDSADGAASIYKYLVCSFPLCDTDGANTRVVLYHMKEVFRGVWGKDEV